jgi:hypothetical protein
MHARCFVAALLAAAPAFGSAGSPVFSIDAHVVAAGTSVRSSSACLRLDATIGEPVAWLSSSADYALSAGFRKNVPVANDTLFSNGFEECAP